MIYILDKINGELISSEIVQLDITNLPLKKNGWHLNWRQLSKKGRIFGLRTVNSPSILEGAVCLKVEDNMLIMESIELAPHHFSQNQKRYDFVAACLIAFSCRESFKIDGDYKGFLTFVSKTHLIRWYIYKYGAELALGQRMFIEDEQGLVLIEKHLNRKSD